MKLKQNMFMKILMKINGKEKIRKGNENKKMVRKMEKQKESIGVLLGA